MIFHEIYIDSFSLSLSLSLSVTSIQKPNLISSMLALSQIAVYKIVGDHNVTSLRYSKVICSLIKSSSSLHYREYDIMRHSQLVPLCRRVSIEIRLILNSRYVLDQVYVFAYILNTLCKQS